MEVFNEEDEAFFFGRERVVQKLLESLKREPRFLAVLGPSGCGKSSVVRAGLIPALRRNELPGSREWGVSTVRPAAQPFEQLENAGLKAAQDGLSAAVQAWLAEHNDRSRCVLLIDQFEEILVSTPPDVCQKFIAELANLLDAPLAFTLVITMRDDFYSRLLKEARQLGGWIERGLVNIPLTITKQELEAIVQKPAEAAGLTFEEGLAETIVADVLARDQEDVAYVTVLPLLEFALTQLWEQRRENVLTHDAYRAMEGVTGGLAQWANKVYEGLDKNERSLARLILELLVHPADKDQGIPDVRQARPIPDIIRENAILTQQTIDKLIQARLLTVKRDPRTGEEIVEIIHDALLVEWGSLRAWLDEDRPSLEIQQQLSEAADAWKGHGSDKSYLFRGRRLDEIEKWLGGHDQRLSQPEREFFTACLQEKRRQQTTTRILRSTAALLVLSFLVVGPGTWGYHEIVRERTGSPLVQINGGTAILGSNDPGQVDHPIALLAYGIEKFEVSNRQYHACEIYGPCTAPLNREDYDAEAKQEFPVVWVTARQANTYCKWLGRRLPTSVEWERAVRGTQGRLWPWGDDPVPKGNLDLLVVMQPVESIPETATVDGEPIYHLVDNVAEWVVRVPAGCQREQCQRGWNGEDDLAAIAGGGFDRPAERVTEVIASSSTNLDASIGFRCVTD
ncbi:MAG TPA: SUMF1/EgtB/PvdO family nonheme iron enzyme [Anaerolineales bacterium]|nr:SUMF1/EgtB/PvdO family nonheme iron enzyme [Anaerolineales bacterium]